MEISIGTAHSGDSVANPRQQRAEVESKHRTEDRPLYPGEFENADEPSRLKNPKHLSKSHLIVRQIPEAESTRQQVERVIRKRQAERVSGQEENLRPCTGSAVLHNRTRQLPHGALQHRQTEVRSHYCSRGE